MKKGNFLKLKHFVKRTGITIVCVSLFASTCLIVNAEEKGEEKARALIYSTKLLENVDSIVDGGQIIVNGETNHLYRVFDDQEKAIADIKGKVPGLLSILSEEFNLSELSTDNWSDYRDAMFMLFDSANKPIDYEESNIEFRILRAFFDIYENYDKNSEILAKVQNSTYSRANASLDNDMVEELALLLPYTEPLVQDYLGNKSNGIIPYASGATYNVTQAVNYANKYATSPNTPTYYYFNRGDCANFVSQILENAGVKQAVYSDVTKGWWHKREKGFLGIGYKHTHSHAWSLADTFARYQGVVYSTTNHNSFKANIKKGSFIVADYDRDGDWDHCGFVTDKTSNDYKVAQHTSNYNAWASTSTNNWDTLGTDGGKYGRVRM